MDAEQIGGAVSNTMTQRRISEDALAKLRFELARVVRISSLGTLTASIAHEVNQPLSGILTNASTCLRMLDADPPNLEGARETARRTLRDGARASEIIARRRALFSGRTAASDTVDLNDAVREVAALCMSDFQRHRIACRMELAGDLRPVAGDRIQLQQVVLNLLLNATEAMGAVRNRSRDLVIRTASDGQTGVCLTVRDAGTGFGRQSVDKLFEAFYTTKKGGAGIGLSVSRSIIENHQGRIWATPNDGPGATFAFTVPCAGEAGQVAGVTRG